eukprot:362508-Chlamydomonas_euryale.AAC.2
MPSRSRSSRSVTTATTAARVGARKANTSNRLRNAAADAAPKSSSTAGHGNGRTPSETTAGDGEGARFAPAPGCGASTPERGGIKPLGGSIEPSERRGGPSGCTAWPP